MRSVTLLLLAALTLGGCSWMPFFGDDDKEGDEQSETAGFTEKDFYDAIQRNLRSRSWETAIENLQALEAQFPFGNYAEQAQLELIYAYYRSADYEAAIAAADRFIRLHPRHPNVDYAYYMKGLASLSQSRGFFANFLPVDQTNRDPGSARTAFATFSELLAKYPDSPYAAEARKRLIHLRNILARYEIHVANYYFEREAYLAAANRGRYVVENFQKTPAVPDGLAVMAEAYRLLGMEDLSRDAARVLAANYPDYPTLDESGNFKYQRGTGEQESSWVAKLTLGLYEIERPPSFDTRELYNPQYKWQREEAPARKKSWLNWISFGLFD